MWVLVFLEKRANKRQGVQTLQSGNSNSSSHWCLCMEERHTEETLSWSFIISTRTCSIFQPSISSDSILGSQVKFCTSHSSISYTTLLLHLCRSYSIAYLTSNMKKQSSWQCLCSINLDLNRRLMEWKSSSCGSDTLWSKHSSSTLLASTAWQIHLSSKSMAKRWASTSLVTTFTLFASL